jgi:SAM-dependent methyltransferase
MFADCSMDFVCTNIVLQHMEPRYARAYLKEFLRVLAPGGLVIFQLPSELTAPGFSRRVKEWIKPFVPRAWLYRYHDRRGTFREPVMEMYGIPRRRVERFLRKNGARVVDVVADYSPGPKWRSFRYCVTRDALPRQGNRGIE